MRFMPEDLLSALLETVPLPTVNAPRDARALYGLVDHHGDLRYIGSTSSTDQTFYERIHQRHRTGSEGMRIGQNVGGCRRTAQKTVFLNQQHFCVDCH